MYCDYEGVELSIRLVTTCGDCRVAALLHPTGTVDLCGAALWLAAHQGHLYRSTPQ
jgi:hypothetical protein